MHHAYNACCDVIFHVVRFQEASNSTDVLFQDDMHKSSGEEKEIRLLEGELASIQVTSTSARFSHSFQWFIIVECMLCRSCLLHSREQAPGYLS